MEILRTEYLTKIYGKGDNQGHCGQRCLLFCGTKENLWRLWAAPAAGNPRCCICWEAWTVHFRQGVCAGEDVYQMNSDQLAIFRRRQVGLIYQFYNLIPILNVKENITLPCELDGRKVDEERLAELIADLGLSDRVNHLPNQLSGGQQQRVSIGRALINRPAIVLADEPTEIWTASPATRSWNF